MPNNASLAFVVILPDLFNATPYGIFLPSLFAISSILFFERAAKTTLIL